MDSAHGEIPVLCQRASSPPMSCLCHDPWVLHWYLQVVQRGCCTGDGSVCIVHKCTRKVAHRHGS